MAILAGAGPVLATDRLEICVADDDDDIDRLRAMLVALEAEQDGLSDDPHRAVFRTSFGRLECLEMSADAEFAELERRAGQLDFGNGVNAETALHHDLGIVHVDRDYERISEVRPLVVRRLG